MLYEDFVVMEFGFELGDYHRSSPSKDVNCTLQGADGQKTGFSLRVQGCVGQDSYRRQYGAIMPLLRKGAIWHCYLLHQRHNDHLALCIAGILPKVAYRVSGSGLGDAVTAAEYLDRNRGFWVSTRDTGPWTHLPEPICLEGEAYLPFPENQTSLRYISFDELKRSERVPLVMRRSRGLGDRLSSAVSAFFS